MGPRNRIVPDDGIPQKQMGGAILGVIVNRGNRPAIGPFIEPQLLKRLGQAVVRTAKS